MHPTPNRALFSSYGKKRPEDTSDEIYQHEKAQQIEFAKMMHVYQQKQGEDDDWNNIPMAAQQPSPASPTHHLAKVPSFGVKQLDYVDYVLLTNKEQKRLFKESQRFTKS